MSSSLRFWEMWESMFSAFERTREAKESHFCLDWSISDLRDASWWRVSETLSCSVEREAALSANSFSHVA